ncbi:MAG: hydantoinase/oxoprolinase family protein [Alphaproteobacteria bacterium]
MWHVGIDVGGTFTDLFAFEKETGESRTSKVLTIQHDRAEGVFNALKAGDIPAAAIHTLVHGSTTATNALVERSYPPAVMIATEGFRDVIEIGRQRRKDLFDLNQQRPKPIIPRRRRFTVPGRLGADGGEIAPLDEDTARQLARKLKAMDVASIAICFLNAYANPAHEMRMREILHAECPDCFVALSSETVRKFREHGRFMTTVVRAVLLPVMSSYYDRLNQGLLDDGFTGTLLVLKSNGGMMGVELARERPEELIESGPAGGVAYARYLSEHTDLSKIIHTDMGGTTFDASIVEDGHGLITHDYDLEWGMLIVIPMLDIRSVGDGGGSIAWIDAGGSLRVGPKSAGADPSPACYQLGGNEATITDANLVLGRLEPTLGGKLTLDGAAAERVVTRLGERINLPMLEVAEAIISICCENMAQAIKLVLVDRGRDPRDFVLANFGGAGAMHACAIARAMRIPKIIVPTYAGVASAFGAIAMDLRHDLEAFYYGPVDDADFDQLNLLYDELETRGRELLGRDGVAVEDMVLSRNAQMRYVGQFWEILAPIPAGKLRRASIARINQAFHAEHETEHGVNSPSFAVEFVSVGLTATGRFKAAQLRERRWRDGTDAETGTRPVYFDGAWQDASVYDGDRLGLDVRIEGPAVVEYAHSGTVLPPGTSALVDNMDNLIITVD